MNKFFHWTTAFFSALSIGHIVTIASPSQAAIINGSFENGLSNWNTRGDVSTQTSTFGSNPTAGNLQALLTTAATSESGFNFSGTEPNFVGVTDGLEDFLDLPIGSVDPNIDDFIFATEGSAIKQEFSANAGNVLSFDWNFLSNDDFLEDYAFVVLKNNLSVIANITNLAKNFNTIFDQETGFKTFFHNFDTSGDYTLAIGVVDIVDVEFPSALLVDNVQIRVGVQPPISVPEPGYLLSLLIVSSTVASSGLIRRLRVLKP